MPIPFFCTHTQYIMAYFSTNFQRTFKVACDVHLFALGLSHCYCILYPQQKLTLTCPLFLYTVALGVKGKYCSAFLLLWFLFPSSFLSLLFSLSLRFLTYFWATWEISNNSRHKISSWKLLINLGRMFSLSWVGSFNWQIL